MGFYKGFTKVWITVLRGSTQMLKFYKVLEDFNLRAGGSKIRV